LAVAEHVQELELVDVDLPLGPSTQTIYTGVAMRYLNTNTPKHKTVLNNRNWCHKMIT
jgi:hypothetical protein